MNIILLSLFTFLGKKMQPVKGVVEYSVFFFFYPFLALNLEIVR